MSLEFFIGAHQLTNKYGEPLNAASNPDVFEYYSSEAIEAQNELIEGADIGKIAVGAYVLHEKGNAVVTVTVSTLNESSGLMHEYDSGHLIGSIGISSFRNQSSKPHRPEFTNTHSGMDFSLYSSGEVELVYAYLKKTNPEFKSIYEAIGMPPMTLEETVDTSQLRNHPARYLDALQQQKLARFVRESFTD